MRVGAIMPVYNGEPFLRESLGSIGRQPDLLVVVDDGSTDGSMDVVDLVNVHHHVERLPRNSGSPAYPINVGFDLTAGCDAVTWVSADNVYFPVWRTTLESALVDGVGAVYSATYKGTCLRDSKRTRRFTPHKRDGLISGTACYYGASFLIRREVWEAAGKHRGGMAHDYDHWLRVEEACWDRELAIVGIPEALAFHRVHPHRMSNKVRNDAPIWQAEARKRRKDR